MESKENITQAKIKNGNWVNQPSLCNLFPKNDLWLHMGQNDSLGPWNRGSIPPIGCATLKHKNPNRGDVKTTQNMKDKNPGGFSYMRTQREWRMDDKKCPPTLQKREGRWKRECMKEWAYVCMINYNIYIIYI